MADTDDLEAWRSQLRKGAAELLVLACVARGPAYGVQILAEVNASEPLIAAGALYPLLNRLERRGRLSAAWDDSGGGQPRKYYSLTPSGRDILAAMRGTWVAFRDGVGQALESV